jgi:hypothetical protein
VREVREGPPPSKRPFEHVFIDIRYLDAKVEGAQLYTCWVLEGYSRTILAGTLAATQDLSLVLRVYYLALLNWGVWGDAGERPRRAIQGERTRPRQPPPRHRALALRAGPCTGQQDHTPI